MSDDPGAHVSDRWAHWRRMVDLHDYHTRWEKLEAAGLSAHGEADLIESYLTGSSRPASVLDAGCGMGRVAIELHRRGIEVVGIDLDHELLEFARADAPHVDWHVADLATFDLGRTFDLVAMPGNVMIFCRPEDRAAIVERAAAHLSDDGLLVAGYSLDSSADALTLEEYDRHCAAAGLELVERFATWERDPYEGGDYAVSVHRPA